MPRMIFDVVLCFFFRILPFIFILIGLVLLGDFNCVTRLCNRFGSSLIRDLSGDVLNCFAYEYNLSDVGVFPHASVQHSHFQGSSHARLDRVYIFNRLWGALSDYIVRPVLFRDH